jgi:hypothetical protein
MLTTPGHHPTNICVVPSSQSQEPKYYILVFHSDSAISCCLTDSLPLPYGFHAAQLALGRQVRYEEMIRKNTQD